MSDRYTLEHYTNKDNKRKEEVLDLMLKHNSEFAKFDLSLVEGANEWLVDDKTVTGQDAVEAWYNQLWDELIVITLDNEVVAVRFVEYDEDDEFFRKRVDNYSTGLNLTFALVDKEHRQNGLWSRMYDYVINNILPNYDVDRLYLATSSENNTMQNVVEKNGFEKMAVDENDRGDGIHTLVYCNIIG